MARNQNARPAGDAAEPELTAVEPVAAPVEEAYVYVGPTLPKGALNENAVFRGTRAQAVAYLAMVAPDYPQAEKLLVPAGQLGAAKRKIAAGGNMLAERYVALRALIAAAGRKG